MVTTSDINVKTTAATAKKKAQEFLRELKLITPEKKVSRDSKMWSIAGDVYAVATKPLATAARNAFIFSLGEHLKVLPPS
jgi:hypothetical protein